MTRAGRRAGVITPGAGEILQILRDGVPRSRPEIVAATGLARATVVQRIEALLAAGFVQDAGEGLSSGGRPPSRIEFNSKAGYVLAVDIGVTFSTVAVADLSGSIISSRADAIDVMDGPTFVFDHVLTLAADLLKGNSISPDEVIGVGVGIPATVEYSTGVPVNPPMAGWDRFDVPSYIKASYDVPVIVDNDVNVLTLGEHGLHWPEVDDLILIKVSTGIGAGVISGGRLQRGANGAAGSIGNARVPRSPGSRRPPADDRGLQDIASGQAIVRELQESGTEVSHTTELVALIQTGDTKALELTRQAGREVGEVLANLVDALNPSIIVLAGSIARASEHLLAGVREVVYRRSIPLATEHLEIVRSHTDHDAGVLGAAMMVIERLLTPGSVDLLVGRARQ
jgi:glucokinase